jgi:hypothetical protein
MAARIVSEAFMLYRLSTAETWATRATLSPPLQMVMDFFFG